MKLNSRVSEKLSDFIGGSKLTWVILKFQ